MGATCCTDQDYKPSEFSPHDFNKSSFSNDSNLLLTRQNHQQKQQPYQHNQLAKSNPRNKENLQKIETIQYNHDEYTMGLPPELKPFKVRIEFSSSTPGYRQMHNPLVKALQAKYQDQITIITNQIPNGPPCFEVIVAIPEKSMEFVVHSRRGGDPDFEADNVAMIVNKVESIVANAN